MNMYSFSCWSNSHPYCIHAHWSVDIQDFWLENSLGDRLEVVDQLPGHHTLLISPLEIFFFWEYVNDHVYKTLKPPDLATFHEQVDVVAVLQYLWITLEYGLEILETTNRAQVEICQA